MSKGAKIFINILYYILTFSIGVLIAIAVPAALIYSYSMKDIKEALNEKEYDRAMQTLGGYYEKEYNYLSPNGDLVLFNAVTLIYNSGEEGDTLIDGSKIHKSYCGYYFNIPSGYYTSGEIDTNQTKLLITDKDGNEVKYNLIDYDYNQDGTVDSISTLVSYDFIFFEIPIEKSASVAKLDFYDKNGAVFYSIEFEQALDFSEDFFTDVDAFVEEYNRDYESTKLVELDNEFLSKNPNYKKSSNGDIIKIVNRRVSLYVVLYFLLIYLIGDSLIGGRFVYKGIKWLIIKIFRKKKQEDNEDNKKAEYIGDIYSNLTIELDVTDDFTEPVTITYSNEKEDLEFYLVKEDGYKQTKRVKAGTYVNMKVLVSSEYEVINPKQVLEVKRFNEKANVKIRRKEGEKG